MPDVLIRDVSAEDLAALDRQARRAGLTRTEYLRRRLHAEAHRTTAAVGTDDLSALAALLPDLDAPDVMRAAWS
ncbi:antitoxin [Naumannella sp. ID2617S]|nr:antitoxin [Naumannella sp. ID2617S]